jgi:hypothetical protein
MKLIVLVIIVISLLLIFRICFPKQKQRVDKPPVPGQAKAEDAVIKSRYVLPDRRNLTQTAAIREKNEKPDEKPDIFAAGNGKSVAVIPPEDLPEIFGEDPDPEELDIEPDGEEETDEPDLDAEAEELEDLQQQAGQDVEPAGGFSMEELGSIIEAVSNPTDEKAEILCKAENIDVFEKLVSGDEGRAERIKTLIDSHVRSRFPQEADTEDDSEYRDIDMMQYLS